MDFLVGEKGYFSNSFSKLELTWQLTSNDAFIRQTSLHTSISVGGLRKSQRSKVVSGKKQRRHCSYVLLVARQMHIQCAINQLGTRGALEIVFLQ